MANKGARRDPGLRDSRSVIAQYQSHRAGESVTNFSSFGCVAPAPSCWLTFPGCQLRPHQSYTTAKRCIKSPLGSVL